MLYLKAKEWAFKPTLWHFERHEALKSGDVYSIWPRPGVCSAMRFRTPGVYST